MLQRNSRIENPELTPFYLRTLGSLRVVQRQGASETPVLPAGKPAALIAYLICQSKRSASRDHLVELLWGDADEERGRHSLRQTVLLIRKRFGDDAIVTGGSTLTCSAQIGVDRDDLLRAVRANDAEEAIRCYAGDFLSNFAAPDTIDFEHWAAAERASLREAFLQGLAEWIRIAQQEARFDDAVRYCREGVNIAPERESLWRQLIESHVLSGTLPLAHAEAERLQAILAADEREPEAATVALFRRLAKESGERRPPTDPAGITANFVGREDTFAKLLAAWNSAAAGPVVVYVTGSAGMGKTRLLDELARRLQVVGARIARARGRQGERDLPFGIAGDVAAALGKLPGSLSVSPGAADALLGLAPALSVQFRAASADRSDDPDAARRRGTALAELAESVAEERPLALLVDDLHWGDAASLRTLDTALVRLRGRILVVLTTREPILSTSLDSARTVALERLDADQVEALVSSLGRIPDETWTPSWLKLIVASSEGVPLAVMQLVLGLLERELLVLENGEFRTASPSSLLTASENGGGLRLRLERLPAQSQQLLAVLAAAGTAVPRDVAAEALGISESVLAQILLSIEASGLARESHAGAELGHDVIGDEVASVVPAAMRREAARSLGRVLLRRGLGDESDYRRTARILSAGEDWESLEDVSQQWLRIRRATGWRRPESELRALLGEAVPAETIQRLLKALPWYVGWSPSRIATATVLALTAAVILLAVMAPRFVAPAGATHLALVTVPVSDTAGLFVVSPVVEIRGADGRRIESTIPVRVEFLRYGGNWTLAGRLTERANHGIARFDSLRFDGDFEGAVDWQLRFSAEGLTPAVTTRFGPGRPPSLFINEGTINGQRVDSSRALFTVQSGDSIRGVLRLHFRSVWSAASVMLGLTPTWGDRRLSAQTISAIPTPVERGSRDIAIALKAPEQGGDYHVILVMEAEPDAAFFLSGTNWKVGAPRWGDGNDVVDWTATQLQSARDSGYVLTKMLRKDRSLIPGYLPQRIAAAVLDVRVQR